MSDQLSLLIVLINTAVICSQQTPLPGGAEGTSNNTLLVYRNLDELVDLLRRDPSPLAISVLESFRVHCLQPFQKGLPEKRTRPFIVIEGNHRLSRGYVGKKVARQLQARYMKHPAHCLSQYIKVLPRGSFLRNAYFHLSIYASSIYARSQVITPVVLNGYWTEQLAFTMYKAYPTGELPSVNSSEYALPEDLLQPDLIIYLDLPDDPFINYGTTRPPSHWKPRTLEVMKLLQSTHPLVIQEVKSVLDATSKAVNQIIRDRFGDQLYAFN